MMDLSRNNHLLLVFLFTISVSFAFLVKATDSAVPPDSPHPNSSRCVHITQPCYCYERNEDVDVTVKWENESVSAPIALCPKANLQTIPDLFSRKLKSLYMPRNAIINLSGLSEYPELEYVNLSTNAIATLERTELPFLRVLDVSDNALRDINHTSFCGFPKLTHLYMRRNFLAHIAEGAFGCLDSLQYLDLQGNHLNDVGFLTSMASFVPSLKWLNLSGNEHMDFASKLDVSSFSKVETLDVSGTCITNLTAIFDRFPNVLRLRIDGHSMPALPLDELIGTSLQYLETGSNGVHFLTFPSDIADRWPANKIMNFNGWHLNCDCNLWKLIQKFSLDRFQRTFQDIPCMNNATESIENMEKRCSEITTYGATFYGIVVSLSLLGVVVIAGVVIYCCRRPRFIQPNSDTESGADGNEFLPLHPLVPDAQDHPAHVTNQASESPDHNEERVEKMPLQEPIYAEIHHIPVEKDDVVNVETGDTEQAHLADGPQHPEVLTQL